MNEPGEQSSGRQKQWQGRNDCIALDLDDFSPRKRTASAFSFVSPQPAIPLLLGLHHEVNNFQVAFILESRKQPERF